MVDSTNTDRIDAVVDDYYDAQNITGTGNIMERVIVKQAMKDNTNELAKNNEWVRKDIAGIEAYQKSKNRKSKLTDILK